MKNAQEELLEKVNKSEILCATVEYEAMEATLSSFDNEEALEAFLEKLDFNYNASYGEQFVYGFVVLKDGSWLEREEYDGSEWWSLRVKPKTF